MGQRIFFDAITLQTYRAFKSPDQEYFQKLNFKNLRLAFFLNNLYSERDCSAMAFLMLLGWFNKKNAGYLVGGSLPLAGRMADRYRSIGGRLTLGRQVNRIIVELLSFSIFASLPVTPAGSPSILSSMSPLKSSRRNAITLTGMVSFLAYLVVEIHHFVHHNASLMST